MSLLQLYAIAIPVLAMVLMGLFGLALRRRDAAGLRLLAAGSAAAVTDRAAMATEASAAATVAPANAVAAPAEARVVSETPSPPVRPARAVVVEPARAERGASGEIAPADVGVPMHRTSPALRRPPAEAAQARARRDLLSASASPRERTRASEPLATDLLSAELRPNPSDAPVAEATESPQAGFDDAPPMPDHGTAAEAQPQQSADAASTFREAATAGEDGPPVTVLKSGVVDGMAYSLYSDGSIDAQTPAGMMRFASIDALRAHLNQL